MSPTPLFIARSISPGAKRSNRRAKDRTDTLAAWDGRDNAARRDGLPLQLVGLRGGLARAAHGRPSQVDGPEPPRISVLRLGGRPRTPDCGCTCSAPVPAELLSPRTRHQDARTCWADIIAALE